MDDEYSNLGSLSSAGVIGTAEVLAECTTDSVVISTVSICNKAATSATYRVAVSTTTSFENDGYLVYDATVPANDTIFLTLGIVLDQTNKYLLCSASDSTIDFTSSGVMKTIATGGGATSMPTMWNYSFSFSPPTEPLTDPYYLTAFDNPQEGAQAFSILATTYGTAITPPTGWTVTDILEDESTNDAELRIMVATCNAWTASLGTQWYLSAGGGGYIGHSMAVGKSLAGGSGLAWGIPKFNFFGSVYNVDGQGPNIGEWESPDVVNGMPEIWFQYMFFHNLKAASAETPPVYSCPPGVTQYSYIEALPYGYPEIRQMMLSYPSTESGSPDTWYTTNNPVTGNTNVTYADFLSNPATWAVTITANLAVGPASSNPGGYAVGG